MVSAVVLLNTDLNAQDSVLESLRGVDGVEEAHQLYGVYDFLLRVKASSVNDLKDITRSRIKRVSGVTSALTLMIDEHKG